MSLRRLFPFFVLLILSTALMTYQSNRGNITLFRFFSPPFSYVNDLSHSFMAALKNPFRIMLLRDEENTRLKYDMNRLVLEQQKYRELYFENQRLHELLALRERERRHVATARVFSKAPDRWTHALVIDKGERDGILKDMAVVTPLGLVGKVSAVTDSYAQVLLITDMNFSAAVKIQETRKDAILAGTGSTLCILKYVPQEEDIKEGEVVVTSGFDDLFPQELIVGYVSKVSKKGASIFQQVEVTPAQDLSKLDEVVIIRR